MNYLDKIIEEIKSIDEKTISNTIDNKASVEIIESQKVFIWFYPYFLQHMGNRCLNTTEASELLIFHSF